MRAENAEFLRVYQAHPARFAVKWWRLPVTAMPKDFARHLARVLTAALVAVALLGPVSAQEEAAEDTAGLDEAGSGDSVADTESADAAVESSPGADEADEVDDSDLDEQTYEEDEDDFIPTEEVPADEPIPFPTNI
jgi:hypothetical protein